MSRTFNLASSQHVITPLWVSCLSIRSPAYPYPIECALMCASHVNQLLIPGRHIPMFCQTQVMCHSDIRGNFWGHCLKCYGLTSSISGGHTPPPPMHKVYSALVKSKQRPWVGFKNDRKTLALDFMQVVCDTFGLTLKVH